MLAQVNARVSHKKCYEQEYRPPGLVPAPIAEQHRQSKCRNRVARREAGINIYIHSFYKMNVGQLVLKVKFRPRSACDMFYDLCKKRRNGIRTRQQQGFAVAE